MISLFAETPISSMPWFDSSKVTMLSLEKETWANQLAAYVALHLHDSNRDDRELWCARMLHFALVLHPQNPRAAQTRQAHQQDAPFPKLHAEHSPAVFAQLLLRRGQQLLALPDSPTDHRVAAYLFALAAVIDPTLEDAMHALETWRIQHGSLDWSISPE